MRAIRLSLSKLTWTAAIVSIPVVVAVFQQGGGSPVEFPAELKDLGIKSGVICASFDDKLVHFAEVHSGDEYVDIRREEYNPANLQLHVSHARVTTSYRITDASSRDGGNVLYVAGLRPNGNDVIERWTFQHRTGGWQHLYTGTPERIGTPSPPYTGSTAINGGVFTVPPLRVRQPRRKVIFEGDLGVIRQIVADPEGRFLLVLSHTTNDLFRINLQKDPPTVETVFTSAQMPFLQQVRSMRFRQHVSQGRTLVMTDLRDGHVPEDDPSGPEVAFQYDFDNDGEFDSQLMMGYTDYLIDHHVPSEWTDPWLQ